jgi:putative SOS response-associated peptidase YedK
MCGRYTAAKDFGELIKLMGIVMARVPFFAPRYNIVPRQQAPVILLENGEPSRFLDQLHAALRALVRFILPCVHCRHRTIRSMA